MNVSECVHSLICSDLSIGLHLLISLTIFVYLWLYLFMENTVLLKFYLDMYVTIITQEKRYMIARLLLEEYT